MEKSTKEIRALFQGFEKAPMNQFLEHLFSGLTQEQKDLLVIDDVSYHRGSPSIVDLVAWLYVKPYDGGDSKRWISVNYMYNSEEDTMERHFCVRDSKRLDSMAECVKFYQEEPINADMGIPLLVGTAENGSEKWIDLEACPHLLVAGASTQGKTEFLECLLEQLRALGNIELKYFKGKGVATDAVGPSLEQLCQETHDRIVQYGARGKLTVVVLDEYQEFIFKQSIHDSILYLLQSGYRAGIHVILTTERPSNDVITPLIKSNVPVRVAFKTFSAKDSKTILDFPGAEKLIGNGDLLLNQGMKLERIQGGYIR